MPLKESSSQWQFLSPVGLDGGQNPTGARTRVIWSRTRPRRIAISWKLPI
jgi:hypothetical protein